MMLFLATALAAPRATPVVHDGGDPAAHVQVVVERTGLPADQLQAVAMADVFKKPPVTLGDAVDRRCAREPSSLTEARGELVRAEARLAANDELAARDHLDLAVARLGCLSEVVDGPLAANIFLLRGGLAAAEGRDDTAREELRTALSLHPQVSWPTHYPAEGSSLLAEVLAEEQQHTLHVLPEARSGPWIDGRDVDREVEVRPGLHLAQHSARKGLVTSWLLVSGESTWALPDALPASALDRFIPSDATPADPAATAHVLVGVYDDAAAVYVSHRSGLWLVQREGASAKVIELIPPEAPAEATAPVEDDGKRRKKKDKKK